MLLLSVETKMINISSLAPVFSLLRMQLRPFLAFGVSQESPAPHELRFGKLVTAFHSTLRCGQWRNVWAEDLWVQANPQDELQEGAQMVCRS